MYVNIMLINDEIRLYLRLNCIVTFTNVLYKTKCTILNCHFMSLVQTVIFFIYIQYVYALNILFMAPIMVYCSII